MARDNKVEIEIILKGAQAAKELKSFSSDAAHGLKEVKDQAKAAAGGLKDAGDATGGLSKALDGLKVAAVVTAAAFAAWKGLKDIVGFLKDAGEEAAGQELALKSLHTTIVANKRAYGDFEQQVIAQAEAMQKLTGFTDDAVESAAKILAPYDAISNDLFPRTLQATADLARALGIDLPQAAQIMGMASLGMTRGLKQIGIDIDDAQFKSIGFAGVLEQVEGKVRGQADAYRTTSKGLSDYIKTMWGEVKEQFGVIVNQVLDPFKDATGKVLSELARQLGEWVKTVDLKSWATGAAEKFKELAFTIIPDLVKTLDEGIPKIVTQLQNLTGSLQTIKDKWEGIKGVFTDFSIAVKLMSQAGDPATMFGFGIKRSAIGDLQDRLGAVKDEIKGVAAVVKATAREVEDTPITPEIDAAEIEKSVEGIWGDYAALKRKIESNPIYIKRVYQDFGERESAVKERLGGLISRQIGGSIPGYGGGDQVPAMLEPGEFVMRKEAVRSLGVSMLNALNRDAGRGGQGGYMVVDFRLGQKSFPITAKKEDVLDEFLKALHRAELIQG